MIVRHALPIPTECEGALRKHRADGDSPGIGSSVSPDFDGAHGALFVTGEHPAQIWAPVGFQGIAKQFREATLPFSSSWLLLLPWAPLEQSG